MLKKTQKHVFSINPSQSKNPVWKYLPILNKTNENQIADFILEDSKLAIMFVSLQFYYQYPLYLKEKFEDFIKSNEYKNFPNRILLCLNDNEDVNDFLTDITLLCYNYDVKLLVGFKYEDIANYLRAFKYIQNNPNPYLK